MFIKVEVDVIYGIGTDIVEVARMQQSLDEFGERFAKRILHEAELVEFQQAKYPANYLAKRFAAKEAFVKALGTGFHNGLFLHHVYVAHNALGKPELCFIEKAAELIATNAITASHITIADEKNYAVAFVILER